MSLQHSLCVRILYTGTRLEKKFNVQIPIFLILLAKEYLLTKPPIPRNIELTSTTRGVRLDLTIFLKESVSIQLMKLNVL